MSESHKAKSNHPIDVVILWVDGNDPRLAKKREQYLNITQVRAPNESHPTRFSSLNEIRYCVLSIFKFAPFVRNIFIVTDEQDPNLYKDIKTYFPERLDSIRIVDHKEIFKGYEEYLPTFNSTAIESLIWRIDGLSENFVYFNDDFVLIRKVNPEDWFINNRPVLRGKWLIAPYKKILKNYLKIAIHRHLLKNPNYQPKFSFYISQWYSARLLGMKFRYFFNCHIPYVFRKSTLENFFKDNREVLKKNILSRFRTQNKYNLTTLANHLEILSGNTQFAKLNLGYLHPYYSKKRLYRRIERCKSDPKIKSICIQSLDMFDKHEQDYIFNWMDEILELTDNKIIENNPPIDAVIAWVDGNDPKLAEKRSRYLKSAGSKSHPGAHPTRFASINEIRYCVLSILKFAPFVRNIFIVTDDQDPNIYDDIKKYYPERLNSVKIIDHKEIFEGFEEYLPTFNSISIGNMIWRIKGLSDNFVYFNDDTFLIRDMHPEDWFIKGRPVMRGRWVAAPILRILWNNLKKAINKYLLNNSSYKPRASFHMGQWHSASLLGFKSRYFTNSHTPHTVERKTIEVFFGNNKALLENNISFRFRDQSQFTFIALSNHLQILDGNKHIVKPGLAYLQPYNRYKGYIEKKIRLCESDPDIKYICVQSLEMCTKEDQEELFSWLDKKLDL